jgi:hypothetical protein
MHCKGQLYLRNVKFYSAHSIIIELQHTWKVSHINFGPRNQFNGYFIQFLQWKTIASNC